MVMRALREGASGGIVKILLFGFLAMAVGGLVLMDMGGFFRGGVTKTDVVKVGDETIGIQSFDRTVRRTLSQIGMTPQQAYELGYIEQLLNNEIRARLLHQAAEDAGILVGEEPVAAQIRGLLAPMTGPGQSNKEVLQQLLANQGMGEGEFVSLISQDMAINLLGGAIQNGLYVMSDDTAKELYRRQFEKRDIAYLTFTDDRIEDIEQPTDEQLRQLYEMVKENYAQPETRTLQIISLNTESMKDTLEISEEEIRDTYENNIEYYTTPAQRTLEQALVSTEDNAGKIVQAVRAGARLEKAVTDVTGRKTDYLGEEKVQEDGLLPEVKQQVLSAQKAGDVIGPVKSPLGWHVIVIKDIRDQDIKDFSEVKDDIRNEIADNMIIDHQYDLAATVDDLLASGASVEEVQEEVPLNVTTLPPVNNMGLNAEGNDVFSDYAESRNDFIDSGFDLAEGETSAIMEAPDGRFAAVHVQTVKPKTYTPFEDIKTKLAERWINDQKRAENKARAAQALQALKSGEITLQALADKRDIKLSKAAKVARDETPQAPFTLRTTEQIFAAPIDTPFLLDVDNGLAVAEVTGYTWPDISTIKDNNLKNFRAGLLKNARDEAMALYLAEKSEEYDVTINRDLLEQVYGPGTQSY